MKQAVSVPLKAFLLSNPSEAMMADCLTITLQTGVVYRFTSFDVDVSIGANLFTSMGTRFIRGPVKHTRGVETSTLDFKLAADNADDLTGGTISAPPVNVGLLSFTQAGVAGLLYLATVKLETVYGDPNTGSGLSRNLDGTFSDGGWGSIIKFVGFVAQAAAVREIVQLQACSNLHLLEAQWPYFIIQPTCRWRLFDNGCTLQASSFAVSGTSIAGSTQTQVKSTLTNPSGYFNLGRIVFTSGLNNGLGRQIKSHLGAGAALDYPTTVLNDKPSLYLRFNETVGATTAVDSSGNGYNATSHGTTTFGQTSMLAGDPGTGVKFDGSTAYFSVGMPIPANYRAGVTFEFWYMLNTGAGATQPTGIFDTNPGVAQPHNWRNNGEPNDTKPGFEWWRNKPFIGINPPSVLSPQHCVVVFRAGQTIDLYINGQAYNSITAQGGGAVNWGNSWAIGRTGINTLFTYFNGILQHFAVYPFAMGISTVLTHYTAGTTAPGSNTNALMNLTSALPYAPALGDTFTAYPGCDRTQRTCEQTFNNKINFGGEPYIPSPEQGS